MVRIGNAFRYRAGDAEIIDTDLFLHLYVPTLLGLLKREDLHAPKLLVVRGSPGSGKSSLLRLFQVDTLLALSSRQTQTSEQSIVELLRELGAWGDEHPRALGIYLQCDSSLRDLANVDANNANPMLLNALLDVRIMLSFLRSLERLEHADVLTTLRGELRLQPLPPEDSPPPLFAEDKDVNTLRVQCEKIGRDFATLLNSFPGDPIPEAIRPHARVFSIPYLARQVSTVAELREVVPIVMLDNLHDLYDDQRKQIHREMLRRAAIPRWVSVRKHVYALEELVPVVGAREDRDYREIDLDSCSSADFRRFVSTVADRRWQQSEGVRDFRTRSFRDALIDEVDEVIERSRVEELADQAARSRFGSTAPLLSSAFGGETAIPLRTLLQAEGQLILAERKAARGQIDMFELNAEQENAPGKVEDAARLFLARRLRLPYYYSFPILVDAANGNIEQFLSIAAIYADKLIFRADLGRNPVLTPKEQQDLLRRSADEYYERIDRYDMGYAIRTLIENLGRFFEAVTYRPTAPIAPGVNGFGLTPKELRSMVRSQPDESIRNLALVLTKAVAENVLFVRHTKQGKAGTDKIVFYLNRLLCIRFNLPLSTGGWQHLSIGTLTKMMAEQVSAKEWGKKWTVDTSWFGAGG